MRGPARSLGSGLAAALLLAAGPALAAKPGSDDMPPGIAGDLARALSDTDTAQRRAGGGAGARSAAAEGVRADVVLAPGTERGDLAGPGIRIHAFAPRYGRATVTVADRAALQRLGEHSNVRLVRRDHGYRRRAGSVDSRAVPAMNVDDLRTMSGLTGDGVTVGILSDSISRTDDVVDNDTEFDGSTAPGTGPKDAPVTMTGSAPQDSGDLPSAIEILRDNADDSIDEGAAMAELIHDIAPDADIVFHSATGGGIAGFAEAIDRLCEPGRGVDVIVDDIGFLAELMYQRDAIARAAEACVERGTAFFSAAGNGGARALQQEFDDRVESDDDEGRRNLLPIRERDFHDWQGGDPYLRVRVPPDSSITAVLQWNQPALSVPGNADNGPRIDLDLWTFAAPTPIAADPSRSSYLDQRAGSASAGQDPIEIVELSGGSSGRTFYLAIDHWAGAQEQIPQDDGTRLEFRLVFFESGSASDLEYPTTGSGPDPAPSMYGHTVATGVRSVGAVPWYDAGPFRDATNAGPTSRIDPEPFTALGGALQRHFRPDGDFRRGTQPPQPALAATDFNNTTFFGTPWADTGLADEAGEDDGHPNFIGTSAAAPNAAAVAALLLEDRPGLAPDQLAARLQTVATDVRGANAAAGCDARTGAGLIAAAKAVNAGDAAPTADAGSDADGEAGDTITLDGSASSDNDFIERYRWRQVAGPRVDLNSPNSARTDFEVPDADAELVFELRVSDPACLSDADRVSVEAEADDSGGGAAGGLLAITAMLVALRRRAGGRQRSATAGEKPENLCQRTLGSS